MKLYCFKFQIGGCLSTRLGFWIGDLGDLDWKLHCCIWTHCELAMEYTSMLIELKEEDERQCACSWCCLLNLSMVLHLQIITWELQDVLMLISAGPKPRYGRRVVVTLTAGVKLLS